MSQNKFFKSRILQPQVRYTGSCTVFLLTFIVCSDKHDQRRTRAVAQMMNDKGTTVQQIAGVLNMSQRTVKRWRKENFAGDLSRGKAVVYDEADVVEKGV